MYFLDLPIIRWLDNRLELLYVFYDANFPESSAAKSPLDKASKWKEGISEHSSRKNIKDLITRVKL